MNTRLQETEVFCCKMAEQGGDNWRSEQFRQKVVQQIEDAVRQAGNPTSKSSLEMENHVFTKAKTREEYLALVARLIIHVREINKKDKAGGQSGIGMATMGSGGMQGMQDPINALQNLAKQGVGVGGMHGPQMGQGPMSGQSMQQRHMMQQMLRGQQQGQPRMSAQPSPQMPRAPGQPYGGQGGYSQPSSQSSASVPSPAPMSQPIHSPANPFASPSPGPGSHMAPSPAPPTSQMGVASPRSVPLNTPGNPASVGPALSPAPLNSEDQAYLDKLKQLSKYIEPLRRMISKIDKDEDRKKDLSKMKNLLEILSDSSKRLPMKTLLKCEQVLEKLELQVKTGSSSGTFPTSTTTTIGQKGPEQHMCQPLLDAVAAHIKSPLLNHTLERTFGPAVTALHGTPIRAPSPPAKKLKLDNDDQPVISNIIQGEVARLGQRFRVELDPIYPSNSKTLHFICKLDDKHLPSVPPISITVPTNYPEASPQCDTTALEDYEATSFLQSVQRGLTISLTKLPNKYSITALLDTWEMSVRQACGPTSTTTCK